jgi:hypothetical protein
MTSALDKSTAVTLVKVLPKSIRMAREDKLN